MEAYSDQRRKTHDFQNQLAIIYGLAQQESPDSQVLNYVRPLLKKEMLPTLITKTGRNVVDILLTQKYSVAIKNQILFQIVFIRHLSTEFSENIQIKEWIFTQPNMLLIIYGIIQLIQMW